MKTIMKIKLGAYRFLTSSFGKPILTILSYFVSVNNLNGKNKPKNHPFIIAITTDTESGYVEENERRVWQKEDPEAFEGYYCGIRNLLDVFEKHDITSTFFLSTQCFSSKDDKNEKIRHELRRLQEKGHELGLHLHPDSDFALQRKMNKKFQATSAVFYDYEEKYEIIKSAKELLKENLPEQNKEITSFRWGNWALDTEGAKALNELEFKIDSSATPGIKGHLKDGMRYDWSKTKNHYTWKLSLEDYQKTEKDNSDILEIPIATFDFFGKTMRADPVNATLLKRAFEKYHKNVDRSKKPFVFVIITHSSESTYKDGSKTRTLKDLDEFISFAKKYEDVEFSNLKNSLEI